MSGLAIALRAGGPWAGWVEVLELHEHYAHNALAIGHLARCALVTTPVNWPTLIDRPRCDCGKGQS